MSKDGTRKRAYALHDGSVIESVLMCYRDGRRTACISSQVRKKLVICARRYGRNWSFVLGTPLSRNWPLINSLCTDIGGTPQSMLE